MGVEGDELFGVLIFVGQTILCPGYSICCYIVVISARNL